MPSGAGSSGAAWPANRQDALVEHLQGEVTYLRERLEEADRQRGYLQQQLEQERQRADVLQAIAGGQTSEPEPAPDAATIAPASPLRDAPARSGVIPFVRARIPVAGRDDPRPILVGLVLLVVGLIVVLLVSLVM